MHPLNLEHWTEGPFFVQLSKAQKDRKLVAEVVLDFMLKAKELTLYSVALLSIIKARNRVDTFF